jgi:hypothetical protein
LEDISSYPAEFLVLRCFIIFSTYLVDTHFRLIFGKGVLKDCNKYYVGLVLSNFWDSEPL